MRLRFRWRAFVVGSIVLNQAAADRATLRAYFAIKERTRLRRSFLLLRKSPGLRFEGIIRRQIILTIQIPGIFSISHS
jgi:hypothetical protein